LFFDNIHGNKVEANVTFQLWEISTETGGLDMAKDRYESPLGGRYASPQMLFLFSDDRKFGGEMGWRGIWYQLALAERDHGVDCITEGMLDEMLSHLNDPIDYVRVAQIEKKNRHDVMANNLAYGEVCPGAKGIIALAATSCDTTDNVEQVIMREGMILVCKALARVIARLGRFAEQYKSLPTLGYTHYQPASLITVGKRACMWNQNYLMDLQHLQWLIGNMRLRGLKGATGTQASYLELFGGDHGRVLAAEKQFAAALGFNSVFTITGQTYTRKVDSWVLGALSSVAESVCKMAMDIRLLAHDKEIEEPFESGQIGSSAMAYKRNPMRCERACSLSRIPMAMGVVARITESIQFLERSLDDSAARRIAIAEAFLAVDAILRIIQNVSEGLVVYPAVIARRISDELPFMATEKFIIEMVSAGADRQECHEKIRVHSQEAGAVVKQQGKPNDLLERLLADPYFAPIHIRLEELCDPMSYVGRAPEQVDQFLEEEVKPALEPYKDELGVTAELSV